MSEKTITRIDLEAINPGQTRVRKWYEGWQEGSNQSPDISTVMTGNVYRLLANFEKEGFTCSMRDAIHGQALRGKTTRIDFIQLPDGWHVKEYCYGWEPKTRPIHEETYKTVDLVEARISQLESFGWTIRRWQGGARAFNGEPQPVRDRAAIMSMRRKAEMDLYIRHETGTNQIFYDFAFDF